MAKQIKRNDIVEKDIFKNLIDSADDSITKLKAMNDEFIKMAKTIKSSMNSTKFATTKELNEFIKSTKTATQLSKEQAKVMQELEKANSLKAKAEAELIKVEKEQLRLQDQQIKSARVKQTDDEKQIKINNRIQKSIDDENNAYKRLEKNTRELKNQSKQLGAELRELELAGKRNTKEFNDTAKAFRNVTEQARNGDVALKKLDSQVGDNFRNVGNYEGAINKLSKGLGMLGLAFGVGDVIRGAGRTIIDFDQSIADLVSITGAGGKDLEYFKKQSIELGKGVEGGAKNVIEAYKLIGSAKPELLANAEGLNAVTESAIKLSKASGMDLPASATALTDALNQFGAPAERAGEFINVLANGALFGAAEIPQVTEALLKFGAVAKTSNVSIQESTALIETLASKGLKGAEAGTALRNVMLKLSAPDALPKEAKDMLEKLGIDMEKIADTSIPFADRLEALSPILKNETAQIKVFGIENVVSAKNLLMNIEGVRQLTKDMDTKGTVDKQAIDRTKTLNQAIIELKGAWEEIVLSFSSGTGASQILVETLSFIARNMGTILTVVTKLGIAYGVMITYSKAMILINKLKGKSFADLTGFIKDAISSTKKLKEGQEVASQSAKNFGLALKTIGFGIAIELALEFVKALYDIATGANVANAKMEQFEKTKQAVLQSNKVFIKGISDEIEANRKKLELDVASGKIIEANATKQRIAFLNEKKYFREVSDYRTRGQSTTEYFNIFGKIKNEIEDTDNQIQRLKSEIKILAKQGISTSVQRGAEQGKIDALELKKQGLFDYNQELKDELHNLTVLDLENAKSKKTDYTVTASTKGKAVAVEELNTKFKETNKIISEQIKLLNELENIYRNRAIDSKTDELEAEFDKQIELAEKTGEANLDMVNQLLQEETELKKAQIVSNLEFKIGELQREYEALVESKKKELDLERITLLAQKGLSTAQKEEINANYKIKQAELDTELETAKSDTELKKKLLTEGAIDDVLKLEKDKNIKIKEYDKDLANAKKKHLDEVTEQTKKDDAEKLDKTKKMFEEMDKLAKMSADYFIKQSQKKIEQIDAEITALGVQKQFLEQLAVNGSITAEKSLAQNEKLTAEANKKKAQELKKQERIKLAETVFTSYSANVQKGEGNAIVKTISDISVLTAFINSLPTFYTGTERTVAESLGKPQLSGRDGHIVRVDGSEKILNPELSKMTGNMTTMEIAKLSEDKLRGRLMYKNDSVLNINSVNNDILISKFDELNNAIINKPEVNIELGEIVGGVMHIIESSKKANTTTRNIRRFS